MDTPTEDSNQVALDPERKDLLAWVGAAIAEAQGLELAISTYVLLVDPDYDPSSSKQVVADRFDELRGKALGLLMKELARKNAAPGDFMRALDDVRGVRNQLVHHFFTAPERIAQGNSEAGRVELTNTLQAWSASFRALAAEVFRAALSAADQRWGVSAASTYEHARALANGEALPASPAKSIAGIEKTITAEKLEEIGRRLLDHE